METVKRVETQIMDKQAEDYIARIDGTGSDDEWAAATELRALGADFPRLLRS